MRRLILTVQVLGLITTVSGQLPGMPGMPGSPHPSEVQIGAPGGLPIVPPAQGREVSEPSAQSRNPHVINRIAATVNGRPITANEVTFQLRPIAAQLSALYPRQGPEFHKQLATAKKGIINDLIERELVLSDFESKGYQIRDSHIDQEINRTIMNDFNGNRDQFLDNLNKSGLTIRGFRDITKRRLIVSIMRSMKYDAEVPPTPQEIQAEYAKTGVMFRDLTKDRIKYKKIFIPLAGPFSSPEEQLALSERIVQDIQSGNATFEDMARQHSKDVYAEEGGDVPEFERGEIAAEFAAIIFETPDGRVVGPIVDNRHGFSIVLVQKKTLAPAPPLSKIKQQIDAQVRSKRSNERYKQWIGRLRDKAIIKTYI